MRGNYRSYAGYSPGYYGFVRSYYGFIPSPPLRFHSVPHRGYVRSISATSDTSTSLDRATSRSSGSPPTPCPFSLSNPDNWYIEAPPHFVSCDIAYRLCGLYRHCGRILPAPSYRGSGSRTPGSAGLHRNSGLTFPLLGWSSEVAGQNRALHYTKGWSSPSGF